jgi:hypothetical protein
MPNGSIVNVDATTRPDLAIAMRGSGSQFGKDNLQEVDLELFSLIPWAHLRHRDPIHH